MKKLRTILKITCFIGVIICLILSGCSKAKTTQNTSTTSNITTTSQTTTLQTTTTTSQTLTTISQTATTTPSIFTLAQNITTMKYTILETVVGSTTVISTTVYLKNDKMRMEMGLGGNSIIEFIDLTAETMYTYSPEANTAYMTSNVTPSNMTVSNAGNFGMMNPVASGTETIDGIFCQIYEISSSGTMAKIWLWADNGLPIKMVMENAAVDTLGEIDYTNYDFSDIPDSMFVLPADVTIIGAPGS